MNVGPLGYESDETLELSSTVEGDKIKLTVTFRTHPRLHAARTSHAEKLLRESKLVFLTSGRGYLGYLIAK